MLMGSRRKDLDPDLLAILLHSDPLRQLDELVKNALESMGSGGN